MSRCLAVRDLRTTFFTPDGPVRVVDGLSFEVDAGCIVGLIGESGCGKTVTALSILRLIGARQGRVEAVELTLERAGRSVDLARLRERGAALHAVRAHDIAIVFQEPMSALNPTRTVRGLMQDLIRLRPHASRRQTKTRMLKALTDAGLPQPEQWLGMYPHQLSGGLRQRVAIAMALVRQPALLLADEPTTALDVTVQAHILSVLRNATETEGLSVLLIAHDLSVVASIARRIVVMYAGRLAEDSPADALWTSPAHPYTHALLRARPGAGPRPSKPFPVIPGAVPEPRDRPPGCAFWPRCAAATERCLYHVPQPTLLSPTRRVACTCFEQERAHVL